MGTTIVDEQEQGLFPIAAYLTLRVCDPLFYSKMSIATSTQIFLISNSATLAGLQSSIQETIAKEMLHAWSLIDWSHYKFLPFHIRSRQYNGQYGPDGRQSRPTEQLLSTDDDVTKALHTLKFCQGGNHLGINITIYEGEEPPPEIMSNGEQQTGFECLFCGYEHGVGLCIDQYTGIQVNMFNEGYDLYEVGGQEDDENGDQAEDENSVGAGKANSGWDEPAQAAGGWGD